MNGNANIAVHLPEIARIRPEQIAVVDSRTKEQFANRDLDEMSSRIARGLFQAGFRPHERVVLMVSSGYRLFTLTFALFKLGAIPILIDPGLGIRGIGRCIADTEPEGFIGVPKAQLARQLFRWGRESILHCVHIGFRFGGGFGIRDICRLGEPVGPPLLAKTGSNENAAILFTSGSTGPAKGAVYTHGMFQEQVRVMRDIFGIDSGEVDLCTFPLFALFAPALGMTSIVPDMNPSRPAKANPAKLVRAIRDHGVTNLFGSPALINVLSRYGERQAIRLPSLRRIISAGAPVSATVIERMAKILAPGVQVFTPYGATEALPVAVIGSDEVLGETGYETDQGAGICVGRPVGRIEIRIIPIDDGPLQSIPHSLPLGQIGEITVRGPVVSKSYWNRPDADALHKIPDDDTVWHRMGDVGYFDAQGRLWFCGRKSERVVLADQTLFTIPVEAIFNTHPDVFRTALVGPRINGIVRAVLCVELEAHVRRRDRKRIVKELLSYRERFAPARAINDILVFPKQFPVDIRHNAKIGREKLADWAARQLRCAP